MADSFIKQINDRDVGQLLGLVANFSGTIQGVAAFISLFTQSDTDKILNAIDQLRQDIDRDFRELGDLIKQQTQIVVDTVNRDTMALALSRSDIGASRIQEFLTNNNNQALEAAKTESIGGARFFTELGLSSPDLPFFLPGLVKAGTIRIFVIAAEPPGLREPRAVVVDDINLMVTFLASMIDSIKRKVDAAHTISQKSHSVVCPPFPQIAADQQGLAAASPVPLGLPHRIVFVIEGYSHEENGVLLEFFDAQQGNLPCDQPSGFENEARSRTIQARSQGVADELAFLGVPGFEQILQSWRNLLTATA
jgi:hypothetical protein